MYRPFHKLVHHLRGRVHTALTGPHVLAFLPALVLVSYWFGGEPMLIVTALGFPGLLLVSGRAGRHTPDIETPMPLAPHATDRRGLDQFIDAALGKTSYRVADLALFLIMPDSAGNIRARFGQRAAETVLQRVRSRVAQDIRRRDAVLRLEHDKIAVVTTSQEPICKQAAQDMAQRLCSGCEGPILLGGAIIKPDIVVGFSRHSALDAPCGADITQAALKVLENGARTREPTASRRHVRESEVGSATDTTARRGPHRQSRATSCMPWFQPLISNDTGQVSGVEVVIRPIDASFPDITDENRATVGQQTDEFASKVFETLAAWGLAGVEIPRAVLRITRRDLDDPTLADRLAWEADRHCMSPNRLVVLPPEAPAKGLCDENARNLQRLGEHGFGIQLTDLEPGQAEAAFIHHFDARYLRIRRCLVSRIDTDAAKQRLMSEKVILSSEMGLVTVAAGVVSAGEHAMLAQLGCDHVQGAGIARPMPAVDIPEWCRLHAARLEETPRICR